MSPDHIQTSTTPQPPVQYRLAAANPLSPKYSKCCLTLLHTVSRLSGLPAPQPDPPATPSPHPPRPQSLPSCSVVPQTHQSRSPTPCLHLLPPAQVPPIPPRLTPSCLECHRALLTTSQPHTSLPHRPPVSLTLITTVLPCVPWSGHVQLLFPVGTQVPRRSEHTPFTAKSSTPRTWPLRGAQ